MPDSPSPSPDAASESTVPAAARTSSRRPLLVLAVTTILATVTASVLAYLLVQESVRSQARTEALAAAEEFAQDLTTYDHTTLDADFARVLKGSTDPFRSQYADTTENLAMLFTQFQATSTSSILGSGVSAATEDSATVVLFVDQTVENTNSAEPRVDRNRVRIDLEKVDGRWLAAAVTVT